MKYEKKKKHAEVTNVIESSSWFQTIDVNNKNIYAKTLKRKLPLNLGYDLLIKEVNSAEELL